jgi:hypothetical protein
MATDAQISANQANAQLSTGPRTEQGKARSSQNHLTHGLCSKQFIIPPSQQPDFDALMADLRDATKPLGAMEFDLFTQLAHASWKLRRCRNAEADLHSLSGIPGVDPLLAPTADPRQRTIQIYAHRAERGYYRALKELKALQFIRVMKVSGPFAEQLGLDEIEDDAPLAGPPIPGSRRFNAALKLTNERRTAEMVEFYEQWDDDDDLPADDVNDNAETFADPSSAPERPIVIRHTTPPDPDPDVPATPAFANRNIRTQSPADRADGGSTLNPNHHPPTTGHRSPG